MSEHTHILRRIQEADEPKKPKEDRARQAVEQLKAATKGMPLQAQLDICSAILTIEEALHTLKSHE